MSNQDTIPSLKIIVIRKILAEKINFKNLPADLCYDINMYRFDDTIKPWEPYLSSVGKELIEAVKSQQIFKSPHDTQLEILGVSHGDPQLPVFVGVVLEGGAVSSVSESERHDFLTSECGMVFVREVDDDRKLYAKEIIVRNGAIYSVIDILVTATRCTVADEEHIRTFGTLLSIHENNISVDAIVIHPVKVWRSSLKRPLPWLNIDPM